MKSKSFLDIRKHLDRMKKTRAKMEDMIAKPISSSSDYANIEDFQPTRIAVHIEDKSTK